MNLGDPSARLTTFAPLACVVLLLASGCDRRDPNVFQGYVEGEFVYAGSPVAGTLLERAVTRGAEVKVGDLLFVLEPEPERAAAAQAERELGQARARLDDLRKGK